LGFGFAVLPFFFKVIDDVGFCIKIIVNICQPEENDYKSEYNNDSGQADEESVQEE
jgi:hypothetical protein